MALEAIKGSGVPRVWAACDGCSFKDCITCDYERSAHGKWNLNKGQAHKKLIAGGWAVVKGRLHCPSCEAKRKAEMVETKGDDIAPLRVPTIHQKREILDLLNDVYDTEEERYRRGDTDETVADVLGVMPGWVAKLRDEFFGPTGANEDMAALREELGQFIERAEKNCTIALERIAEMNGEICAAQDFQKRLNKIEVAVGKRVILKVAK